MSEKGVMMMEEKRLWFELDKIAVRETGRAWGNLKKADAAVDMMRFLEKPSPEECRRLFIEHGE